MKILKAKGKNVRHYNFRVKPKKPPLMWLVHFLVWIVCIGRKIKIKFNGKKPKGKFLLLGNHASFNDFYALFKSIKLMNLNYVVALDAFNDMSNWLMRNIGAIAKRKFISDLSLMKNMKYTIHDLGNAVVMYPEARYSLDGTTSFLPESLGKLVKFLNVPVYTIILKGNYVSDPQWNKYKANYIPLYSEVTELITQEEIATLSADEINARIQKGFEYDDWKWLKESGLKITNKNRAKNLNALLYQCPKCKQEHKMVGEGTVLTCTHCNKSWNLNEDGTLTAINGETEFTHVPDWFKWQRQNVREEVRNGTYKMEAECEVYTLPSSMGFVKQGKGKLYQDANGTRLTVNLYGEDKVIEYKGTQLESVHIEYNYKNECDMFDFSIQGDSIWMSPLDKKDILTKVSIATEEIYFLAKENV